MVTELVNIQINIPEINKLAIPYFHSNSIGQHIVLNSHAEYLAYRGHGICTGTGRFGCCVMPDEQVCQSFDKEAKYRTPP